MHDDLEVILENLKSADNRTADSEFKTIARRFIKKINSTRESLNFKPYNRDRMVIFINELFYSSCLYHDRFRKDGSPVFASHLISTIDNLLEYEHLTGLTSLLSGLKHDDIEDLSLTHDNLFNIKQYRDQIYELDDDYLNKLQQNVYRIVSGTTKVKRETRRQTKEDTFRKLLQFIRDHGVRVGYVKIADRIHNMKTLSGHGNDDGGIQIQLEIATETEQVYLPLARLFKIADAEEELLRRCLYFFNPTFVQDFNAIVEERKREFLEPFRDLVIKKFEGERLHDELNCTIDFEILRMQEMLQLYEIDVPLENLSLAKIPLDDYDPFHNFVVITDDKSQINSMVGRVVERFSFGNLKVKTESLSYSRGTMLRLHNSNYGGRLYFRINDRVSESVSKRGIIGNEDNKTPPGLREGITSLLNKVEYNTRHIFSLAHEELLKPRIMVYSPNDEGYELPRGATPLDFAHKIHEEVLKGVQAAYISDDVWGKEKRKISLFEELPTDVVVYIDSSLSSGGGKTPDKREIKVEPGWLLYCQSGARAVLARYLRSDPKISYRRGYAYLKKICFFADSEPQVFYDLIRTYQKSMSNKTDNEIIMLIGRGEINLLEILELLPLFQYNDSWHLCGWLPNLPGSMAEYTGKFKPNINLMQNVIEHNTIDDVDLGKYGAILFKISYDSSRITKYEFLRILLKIHYFGYRLKIIR